MTEESKDPNSNEPLQTCEPVETAGPKLLSKGKFSAVDHTFIATGILLLILLIVVNILKIIE